MVARSKLFGFPDAGNNPSNFTTRRAHDLLHRGFGPGFNGPLLLVAQGSSAPATQDLVPATPHGRVAQSVEVADRRTCAHVLLFVSLRRLFRLVRPCSRRQFPNDCTTRLDSILPVGTRPTTPAVRVDVDLEHAHR